MLTKGGTYLDQQSKKTYPTKPSQQQNMASKFINTIQQKQDLKSRATSKEKMNTVRSALHHKEQQLMLDGQ